MAGSMLKEQILLRSMLVKEEIAMRKYIKPTAEVIELSVKESLSALPTGFKGYQPTAVKGAGSAYKNVTIYKKTSAVKSQA